MLSLNWTLPNTSEILDESVAVDINKVDFNKEFLEKRARFIEKTLAALGAPVQVVKISQGPTITQFGVKPLFIDARSGRMRVHINKILSLTDDLTLALSAKNIHIQAPMPEDDIISIEIPNQERTLVVLKDILDSDEFQRNRTSLSIALGKDITGLLRLTTLENMPHLLIAGTTGSGKSVFINSILTNLLLYNTPNDLRLVLVDSKLVELTRYNGIPHLLAPIITDMARVVGALQWMNREMNKRYHTFAEAGVRNIGDYNAHMKLQDKKQLPFLLIVIDEIADLIIDAPKEIEQTITRLAQLASATGIHLIFATQRPSSDVVTGQIKSNFPARIAFTVTSNTDSRIILNQPGAELLFGRGDMLFKAPNELTPIRLQGVMVSDAEIHRLVEFWRVQGEQINLLAKPNLEETKRETTIDPLMPKAVDLVRREGHASISILQRRLRIGYTRATRLMDQMEKDGAIESPENNSS